MKNLKLKLVLLLTIISSTTLFSQGFYISANAGYAFGVNQKSPNVRNRTFTSRVDSPQGTSSTNEEYELVPYSYGKGFNMGLSVGYMLNEYVGFELGASYLIGGKTEYYYADSYKNTLPDGTYYESASKGMYSIYSKFWRVIPSLVLTPNLDKWNPYMRLGMVIGFGTMYRDFDYKNESPIGLVLNTYSKKEESSKGFALGINTVVGVNYSINEHVSVFGEGSFISLSYAPNQLRTTEIMVDGIDKLPLSDTYYKDIDFQDDYAYERDKVDLTQPRKELKESHPFSSIGVNLGVKFNL